MEAIVSDGIMPYTYNWDLYDNGVYNDANDKFVKKSWDKPGVYFVSVKVTDANGDEDTCEIAVNIESKVGIPSGPPSDKPRIECTFLAHETCYSSWDQICYNFDWGDGTYSDLLGPYSPDNTAEVKHSWTSNGRYDVRVKVWLGNSKDDSFKESSWSDPLTIVIRQNKQRSDFPYVILLRDLLDRFPNVLLILRYLLKSLNSSGFLK